MSQPKIIAYFNPYCPWTPGVVDVLEKYGLPFEKRDVMRDPEAYGEMTRKSGQSSTPTLDIDGQILADVGGDEVEDWLKVNGFSASTAS